jgi:hypothetical protein
MSGMWSEIGYVKPILLANKDDKLEFNFNAKAMNVILSGLAEEEFVKVMHIESAKEMWDKRISSYEGNQYWVCVILFACVCGHIKFNNYV